MGYDDVYNAIRSEASPKNLNLKRHDYFRKKLKNLEGEGLYETDGRSTRNG